MGIESITIIFQGQVNDTIGVKAREIALGKSSRFEGSTQTLFV